MGVYEQFVNSCERFEEKTAVVFQGKHYTYGELLALSDRAADFLAQSFPRCRRIGINLHNSPELLVLALAAGKLGRCIVPLNPALRKQQILTQLRSTCCDMLICRQAAVKSWKMELETQQVLGVDACFAHTNHPQKNSAVSSVDLDAPYIVTLSSGSTGDPKPIVLSQRCKYLRSQQARDSYAITQDDTIICASPFYHSLGQRLCFLPLLHGATLVLLEHFSADAWLQAVREYRVSFTIAVSSHLQALQKFLLEDSTGLESLRCLVSSSALLSLELKERLLANLGCEFHEMYGATEVATATNLDPQGARFRPGSVGRPLPGVEISILGDDGAKLAHGETGEIACRSPLVFGGYDAKPRETHAAFRDGFFLTGDLGHLDKDGFLYFVSRKKDIIITGGVNVVPRDIEIELQKLPEIADCCVIGVHDAYLGEAVLAVCVLVDSVQSFDTVNVLDTVNTNTLQTTLRLKLNEVLAGFQQPRYYEFVSRIPLTPSGKPDKQALREKYRELIPEHCAHA